MSASRRLNRSTRAPPTDGVPSRTPRDIYAEMLADAGVGRSPEPQRPLKRRKARRSADREDDSISCGGPSAYGERGAAGSQVDQDDDEEGIEFEDVEIPKPTIQTMYMGSEDEDSEEEDNAVGFEDIDLNVPVPDEKGAAPSEPKAMELNLTAQKAAMSPAKRKGPKKKPLSREEKARRVEVHKMHLLCLLYHCAMRNKWCNDEKVQKCLKALLTQQMVNHLNPSRKLTQFGRTEALKKGLEEVGHMFRIKYQITERGLRRALWAEDREDLNKYEPSPDLETCLDKADFVDAARTLQGSRDVGAQLYCALLRAAGVRTRLVCSLQPLSFLAGGPTLPKPKGPRTPARKPPAAGIPTPPGAATEKGSMTESSSTPVRRRPGFSEITSHYRRPESTAKSSTRASTPRQINESAFPVYWVEVLDVAHQKWQPADPLVTRTFWRTRVFEPPLTDRENAMSYVVAFEADGTARDVTERYTKAFTAKTRRLRVESVDERGGEWWREAMKRYTRPGHPTDLEQIEDNELAAARAREPIPKNIADFKDHPLYILERHLRRNEVLLEGSKDVGTVAAGPKAPTERVYLRRNVRVARSRDKWYRMGRVVKPNEIPVKWLPPSKKADEERKRDDDGRGENGTPLFLLDQTELFQHPPVVDGVVPKNKFGNLDVYVPSMVPPGGVHVEDDLARRAAYILGVDYAPALTGFHFKGRHGTAVLRGVVVPAEAEEGVRSVIKGLRDMETEIEVERRRRECLRMWRRLLMGLRIREKIWAGVDVEAETRAEEEKQEAGDAERAREEEFERAVEEAVSDVSEEFAMDEDYGGGGFLVE
ncbi:hypothetical protein VUR80DRAFT_7635 [Thermomyces stellatus]